MVLILDRGPHFDSQCLALHRADYPDPVTGKKAQTTSEKSAGKLNNRIPICEGTCNISSLGTKQREMGLHLNRRDFTFTY